MAVMNHTYKVTITKADIGYDITITDHASNGWLENMRSHYAWSLTSRGANRKAQRLVSRIKRQNRREEHPREYTIE